MCCNNNNNSFYGGIGTFSTVSNGNRSGCNNNTTCSGNGITVQFLDNGVTTIRSNNRNHENSGRNCGCGWNN